MKKRTLMVHSAVATALLAMVAGAYAGTVSTANTKFAAEGFKTATGTATSPGAVSYNYVAPNGNVNIGGVVYFQLRLTNGATFAIDPVATDFKVAGLAAGVGVTVGATNISADKTTVQVMYTAAAQTALGLNALVWTPPAGSVKAPASFGTPGSTLGVQANFSTVASGTGTSASLDSTNALAASADGVTPLATLATSASAITGAVSNLGGALAYAQKIDLTAVPTASDFTPTTGRTAIGAVTFTNNTTAQQNPLNTAAYTLELDSLGNPLTATIDVTPGAGQSFPEGSILSYVDGADLATATGACAAGAGNKGALPAILSSNSTTKKTLTVAAGDLATGAPIAICMTKPGTGKVAAPLLVTIAAATVPGGLAAGTDTGDTASGPGYFLDYNGQSKVVRNYIPSGVTGYIQTVRVINTGSVAAPVSMTLIGEDGVAGTPVVVIPSLAAGATARLSQAQVEAAVGAIAATARPRLRVTAPTNGMDVQSFFNNANGAYTNLSGTE